MRLAKILILSITLLIMSCSSKDQTATNTRPDNLAVEGISVPLNVHSRAPTLSWHANVDEQTHYQIQVATSVTALIEGQPDLWDSGKTESSRSINIGYKGKALANRQKAHWRVRVWSRANWLESDWSEISHWEMGLTTNSAWSAQWIMANSPEASALSPQVSQWIWNAASDQNPQKTRPEYILKKLQEQPTATLLRRQFSIDKKVVGARLHSTAAGYYEVFINGKKVDSRIMDPGQTDYEERILYNTDAVESLITSGDNVIAAHLGSGWYNEEIAFSKPDKNLSYGQPKLIAQLEIVFDDGSSKTVSTDNSWYWHTSPVLKEGLFSGELFDQRYALDNWMTKTDTELSDAWQNVKSLQSWPTKSLEPQLLQPVRIADKLVAERILSPRKDVWVFDFGQNFTGIPELNLALLDLEEGQAVYLKYAEWIDDDGNISQKSGGAAPKLKQTDAYIAGKTNPQKWRPTFTWHGFRYVEVVGLKSKPELDALNAYLVRSDVPVSGHFSSSDDMINKVHDMALWGYQSNLISVPFDCPIRERAGWTGDAHAALVTGNYNFNLENFWSKYLGDFRTSTYVAPTVVPGRRSQGGKFDWAVAEIIIAWEHYRHHGDITVLADQYDSLQEYMNAGQVELNNNMIRTGYGDWCDPVREPGMARVGGRCTPQHTSHVVTSSALFAHGADLMAKISQALGKNTQQVFYKQLFESVKNQFNEEVFDHNTGHYGSQTADAMAIAFGFVPKDMQQQVADKLNEDVVVNWGGHASVGALGQTYLYRALSDYGYVDTAFNIFKAEGYPGYPYLINELNATTLWERKGGFKPKEKLTLEDAPGRSLNHPFHSGYDGWFYEGLGGIRPFKDTVGFQTFQLKPVFPSSLNAVDVSYNTGYGKIESRWRRANNQIIWDFVIPQNTKATVFLPNQEPRMYKPGKHTVVFEN